MRKAKKITVVLIGMMFFAQSSFGAVNLPIDPEESSIKISIRYTVIGRYKAEFNEYSGEIIVDKDSREIQSVNLRIDPATLTSNCEWCDDIVRSEQLLYVEKYPEIIFRSSKITRSDKGFAGKGTLDLHGVVQEIDFTFDVKGLHDPVAGVSDVTATGQWLINRRDYGLIWNRLLDKGGVLVGNQITVDWMVHTTFTDKKGE